MTHLDTSFLVDLLRESRREAPGAATERLDTLEDEQMAVSVHAACELFAGAELSSSPEGERSRVEKLLEALPVVHPDHRFAPMYGRLLAELRRRGEVVSTMDLLIAAAARIDEARLVTRDVRSFERVPGLVVLSY